MYDICLSFHILIIREEEGELLFLNLSMMIKVTIRTFYTILLYCEKYKEKNSKSKNMFFLKYLERNSIKKLTINGFLIEYFNKYEAFCFDLNPDSVLKGDLNFNYK